MIKHHPVIKIFSVYFVLIFLLSPVLAGGCSTENDKGAGTPVLGGWVSAGQPISAATISIYDIDGKQIYQSEQAVTGEYGSFLFEIKSLPADFKVIAAGGTIDEELFAADLSADYRGFDANIDTVHINPLTTLVNAYYENHQGIGLGDAIAKVKSFLQLPDWLDINEELDVVPQYFSYSEFLSAAASSGGVNKYIEQLVGEMDAQEAATHSFGDEDIVYESSTNMIGTISMWVAQGVVSYAAGKMFGWGMSELGIGFGGDADMNEIKQNLDVISKQLTELSTKLSEMQDKLISEIKKAGYDTMVGQLDELTSAIMAAQKKLQLHIHSPANASAKCLEGSRQDFYDAVERGLLGKENLFALKLLPNTGASTQGLLKAWSQVVKSNYRFLSARQHEEVQAQYDYFDELQQWMMLILVEYYHALAVDNQADQSIYDRYINLAQDAYDEYISASGEQQKLLKPAIPENLYFDKTQNLRIWFSDKTYDAPTWVSTGWWYPDSDYSQLPVDGMTVVGYFQTAQRVWYMNLVGVYDQNNKWVDFSHYGTERQYGTEWRFLTPDELDNMFAGFKSSGLLPAAYLASKGLPLKETTRIPNSTLGLWIWAGFKGDEYYFWRSALNWWYYDVALGINVKMDNAHFDTTWLNAIPAQQVSGNELDRYFW